MTVKPVRAYSIGGGLHRFVAFLATICLASGGLVGAIALSASSAAADTQGPIDFESYTVGNINGQDGWSRTGPYDHVVSDNSTLPFAPGSFGTKSLRISDAVTSGSFGDMTFSKKVNDEAGEPTADAGAYASGTRQSNFQASFDFASVTPATEQPGLLVSVSPDRGDGARMSYVRFDDTPAGWNLTFVDYQDAAPLGSGGNLDDGCGAEDNFISTQIATGLSRSPHNIRFAMKFVPGPHNDIVSISLDGSVVHTGTSWEDYYRYCSESGGGTGGPLADQSRTVRALLFRTAGTAHPSDAGAGILIDGALVASAAGCTTICYVDDATGSNANTGQLGDPLKTIQAGVDDVDPGGTVQVAAGTYRENVTVPKNVRVTGAGVTTIVEPAVSDPNCGGAGGASLCPGASNVFLVQSDGVEIDHLKIDGDNPTLTSGENVGGADIDARNGIITNHLAGVYNNLSVHNVTVKNIFLRGIYASSGGTFNISTNVVDNVQGQSNGSIGIFNYLGAGTISGNQVSNAADGISANHSGGTSFTGNTVTASASGVHTDNAGDSGGSPDVISGNTVSACTPDGYGIWTFVAYLPPTVSGNTVSGCANGLAAFASCDLGGTNYCPGGVIPTVTFSTNNVTGVTNGNGLFVSTTSFGFGDGEVHVNANHNTFSGAGRHVDVEETGTANATVAANRNSLTKLVNSGATTVDARCNWWGTSSGPATGQYFGPATVAPFLATSNLSGACKPIASLGTAAVPTVEGNSGSHIVTLTVTLNGPSDSTVTVPWHTSDGTAGTGDYAGAFGTLTFTPGQTQKPINISVKGDTTLETYENFFVNLGASATATLGNAQQRIVIQNDEKPTLIVSAPASIAEGTNKTFSVTLAQQYYQPITVTIATMNGTATSPSDYAAISKSKTFPAGTTTVGLPALPAIQVYADGASEGAQTFNIKSTSTLINNSPKIVTITIPANNT